VPRSLIETHGESLPAWLARLAELLAVTPDYVFSVSLDGTILWANHALETLIGQRVVGQNVALFRPEWVRELLEREARPTALRDGHWVGLTALRVPPSGERPVRQVLVAHRDLAGELVGYSAVMQDLSAQQEMAERFRVLADTVPVGIFHNDADGKCLWVNSSYYDITGLSAADVLGDGWKRIIAPESVDFLPRVREQLIATGFYGPENVVFVRPDGERRTASVRVALVRARDGTVQGQVGVVEDITARDSAQRALTVSEERLRLVLQSLEEGVVLQDSTGAVRLWNPAAEQILGVTAGQMTGVTSMDPRWRATDVQGNHLPGDQHPAMVVLRTRQAVSRFVMGVTRPDGSHVWIRVTSQPVTMPDAPDEHAALTSFIDVTSEFEADELLRRSERQLRVVTAAAREAICLHDADGTYVWISEGSAAVLGWDAEQLLGKNPYSFFHPDDVERIRRESHEPLLEGQSARGITYRFRRSNESYSWVETESSIVAATDTTPLRLVTTSRLVDYRVASEARNATRQRLGGVALVAGQLAHEFTNLHTVALSRLEMVREQLHDIESEDLRAAFDAIGRASALARELRALSGNEPLHVERIELREFMRAFEPALLAYANPDLQVELLNSGPSLNVQADREILTSAVHSVVSNAAEAMTERGSISLHVERILLAEPQVDPHGEVAAGEWAVIRCLDTGPGIADARMAALFEPRFASNRDTVGTGLGLPITLARMSQMRGHISVHKAQGGGTEVRLWVPLAASTGETRDGGIGERASGTSARTTPASVPRVGTGNESSLHAEASGTHLLLVDDDEHVLRTSQRLLTRAGYVVTAAASGFDALKALEDDDAGERKIALIVTDVMMPGLSGPQFVARRRAMGDTRPVVYMSGYTGDALSPAHAPEAGAVLVAKPFATAELLQVIRGALANVPRSR
jgi:PAS domain S-box-containing protein